MYILKFGGSSVATAQKMKSCAQVIQYYLTQEPTTPLMVVCSALGGVTDLLVQAGQQAQRHDLTYQQVHHIITERHMTCAKELLSQQQFAIVQPQLQHLLQHVSDLLHGIYLLRDLSARTRDELIGLGERLSVPIFYAYCLDLGIKSTRLNALEMIKTDQQYGKAQVLEDLTVRNFEQLEMSQSTLWCMEGFIGSTLEGIPSTLGRGGSDLSAALCAKYLKAKSVDKWTDVEGLMTCDPRLVPSAQVIAEMSYAEAMELCHFGAKVIYPPTIAQLSSVGIPMRVRKTEAIHKPGTHIMYTHDKKTSGKGTRGVCGLSSTANIALLTLVGGGMIGVPGFSKRMFTVLAQNQINIMMITQGSSEHAISIVIHQQDQALALEALQAEFFIDQQQGHIQSIQMEEQYTMIALVGDGMRQQCGVAGRAMSSLGRNGISLRAIAQGSTERNISLIIERKHQTKALRVLHTAFFEKEVKRIHLFCMGVGQVGQAMIQQIFDQQSTLLRERWLDIKVIGLANSKTMCIDPEGFSVESYQSELQNSSITSHPLHMIQKIEALNLENSIFVDNTASKIVSDYYEEALQRSIAVVASNKVACSDTWHRYKHLKMLALTHQVDFRFETNVGAGLPIIDTLQHLLQSGDRVHRIQALLSGTLNYVCSHYCAEDAFQTVIQQAKSAGLTEPDPRLDLSGVDVQRKILILARESGYQLEMNEVDAQPMIPHEYMQGTVDEFMQNLSLVEPMMQTLYQQAHQQGKRLKYVAELNHGKASCGPQMVAQDHAFYDVDGRENIVLIYSDRYAKQPLCIRGAGAGAEVTAMGVFADLIRIASHSMIST